MLHFGDPAVFSDLLVLGMSCSQAELCCVRNLLCSTQHTFAELNSAHFCLVELS